MENVEVEEYSRNQKVNEGSRHHNNSCQCGVLQEPTKVDLFHLH